MAWKDLSIAQRSQLMNLMRRNGISSLSEMRRLYDLSSPPLSSLGENTFNMQPQAPVYAGGGDKGKDDGKSGKLPLWQRMIQGATMAEAPAAMTAAGMEINPDGTITYGNDNEGVRKLRRNLAVIGATGATGAALPGAINWLSSPANQIIAGKIAMPLLGGATTNEAISQYTPWNSWGDMLVRGTGLDEVMDYALLPRKQQDLVYSGAEMTNPFFYSPYEKLGKAGAKAAGEIEKDVNDAIKKLTPVKDFGDFIKSRAHVNRIENKVTKLQDYFWKDGGVYDMLVNNGVDEDVARKYIDGYINGIEDNLYGRIIRKGDIGGLYYDLHGRDANVVSDWIARDASKLEPGHYISLARDYDLSTDSFPLYLRKLQSANRKGSGVISPVYDDGVHRMIQLNDMGTGKNWKRVPGILKSLEEDLGIHIPQPIKIGNEKFVPAFEFQKSVKKYGGQLKDNEPKRKWTAYARKYREEQEAKAKREREHPTLKNVFRHDIASESGDEYYDVINTRYTQAMDALKRRGFSYEDSLRLAPLIVTQNIVEGGWRVARPDDNNFGGLRENGRFLKFNSPEEYYDNYLDLLDRKWGSSRGTINNWRNAQNLDDWSRILNREDLRLWSKERYNDYNKEHRDNPVYLYAPEWENGGRSYRSHLADVEARVNTYLDMVLKENPYTMEMYNATTEPVASQNDNFNLSMEQFQDLLESNREGFAKGGHKIHIKPENRGKFTALKKRTGKSASWFKAHGTPAQKKMAIFALNSRHWGKKKLHGGIKF